MNSFPFWRVFISVSFFIYYLLALSVVYYSIDTLHSSQFQRHDKSHDMTVKSLQSAKVQALLDGFFYLLLIRIATTTKVITQRHEAFRQD